MMKKMWFWVGGVLLIAGSAAIAVDSADNEPTIVYGAAENPEGGQNVFVVEQPKGDNNPLGNPLPVDENPPEVFGFDDEQERGQTTANSEQNTKNLGDDFQNTLLEANGRVYDVQSYPEQDFKAMGNSANPETIYSPNVND